jgi:hypothetical protein
VKCYEKCKGHRIELPPKLSRFWERLPAKARERSSQVRCLNVWTNKKLEPIGDEVIDGLEAWKQSAKWTKDGGEYAEGAHIWLANQQWCNKPAVAGSNGNSTQRRVAGQKGFFNS